MFNLLILHIYLPVSHQSILIFFKIRQPCYLHIQSESIIFFQGVASLSY